MNHSKTIFYVIAAIVLIVVVLLVAMKPGEHISVPTTPSVPSTDNTPEQTEQTVPNETSQTHPSLGPSTQPSDSMNLPPELNPTEPESPMSSFRPDEVTHEELPQTSGNHYMNHGIVGTNIIYEGRNYFVRFGVQAGIQDYIVLNPMVVQTDGDQYGPDDFQFVFNPSCGYVTTITNADYDDYMSNDGSSTFIQALDWALPSAYIDETCPGTIWYREDPVTPTQDDLCAVYVDVRVYIKGEFLAALRLFLEATPDGIYYLTLCGNMNQLEMNEYFASLNHKMTDEQMNALIERAKSDVCQERYGYYLEPEEASTLELKDFIIEWRDIGKGTYFEYTCDVSSQIEFHPKVEYTLTPLVAVSIRSTHSYYRAPITLYYKVSVSDNGEESYELAAFETFSLYYKRTLYYSDYPGYSEPSE